MKIEDLPEYQQARDTYTGAITAARAAQDALAEANAELAWMNVKEGLRDTVSERETAANELAAAMTEVKDKYPTVPESLYSRLTDPEQVRLIAAESADAITSAAAARGPAGRSNQWSAPAATSAAATRREKDRYEDETYLRDDLGPRFDKREGRAIKEVQDETWNRHMVPLIEQRQAERAARRTSGAAS